VKARVQLLQAGRGCVDRCQPDFLALVRVPMAKGRRSIQAAQQSSRAFLLGFKESGSSVFQSLFKWLFYYYD